MKLLRETVDKVLARVLRVENEFAAGCERLRALTCIVVALSVVIVIDDVQSHRSSRSTEGWHAHVLERLDTVLRVRACLHLVAVLVRS
jgi:hypothetical protein